MKQTVLSGILLSLLAVGCVGSGSRRQPELAGSSGDITTDVVKRQDLQGYAFFDGKMILPEGAQLTVYSPVETSVVSVTTGVGKMVERGDTIIKLTIPGADAAAASAKSNVSAAKADYAAQKSAESEAVVDAKRAVESARTEERAARQTIAEGGEADLESATQTRIAAEATLRQAQQELNAALAPSRAAVSAASANLAAARADAARGIIRAPISGTVTTLEAKPGLTTSSTQVLATIVNFRNAKIQGLVPAELKEYVVKGAKVVISFAGQSSDPLDGTVIDVTVTPPQEGQKSAGYLASIRLDEPSKIVPPVTSVKRIGVKTNKVKDAIVVPVSSVATVEGRSTVKVKVGSEWIDKDVKTGVSDGALIEIKSGLNEGDVVQVPKTGKDEVEAAAAM